MKKLIHRLIGRIKARFRLKRIEEATGIKLMRRQRKKVLNPERPTFNGWGKASGKSVAAIFWTLLWRKDPIYYDQEAMKTGIQYNERDKRVQRKTYKDMERAIPDDDGYYDAHRVMFLLREYTSYALCCTQHRIRTCDVFFTHTDRTINDDKNRGMKNGSILSVL